MGSNDLMYEAVLFVSLAAGVGMDLTSDSSAWSVEMVGREWGGEE